MVTPLSTILYENVDAALSDNQDWSLLTGEERVELINMACIDISAKCNIADLNIYSTSTSVLATGLSTYASSTTGIIYFVDYRTEDISVHSIESVIISDGSTTNEISATSVSSLQALMDYLNADTRPDISYFATGNGLYIYQNTDALNFVESSIKFSYKRYAEKLSISLGGYSYGGDS